MLGRQTISQKQKVDEQSEPPHDANDASADASDIPKLKVEFSCAELRSPSPSIQGHFDVDDDDDCLNFLASLDISNEANVRWRVVAFESECSRTCLVIVGPSTGKQQSGRFDADARLRYQLQTIALASLPRSSKKTGYRSSSRFSRLVFRGPMGSSEHITARSICFDYVLCSIS